MLYIEYVVENRLFWAKIGTGQIQKFAALLSQRHYVSLVFSNVFQYNT